MRLKYIILSVLIKKISVEGEDEEYEKNLISVIILALLIVNIVLTAIMMFSVAGASKKTAALVDNIATALNLELSSGTEGAGAEEAVSMADTETYSLRNL